MPYVFNANSIFVLMWVFLPTRLVHAQQTIECSGEVSDPSFPILSGIHARYSDAFKEADVVVLATVVEATKELDRNTSFLGELDFDHTLLKPAVTSFYPIWSIKGDSSAVFFLHHFVRRPIQGMMGGKLPSVVSFHKGRRTINCEKSSSIVTFEYLMFLKKSSKAEHFRLIDDDGDASMVRSVKVVTGFPIGDNGVDSSVPGNSIDKDVDSKGSRESGVLDAKVKVHEPE